MPASTPDEQIPLRRERLKTLVHYICERVPNPKDWGSVKMNKALFYSDRTAYLKLGAPISGETYRRYPMGPVSDHLQEVVQELVTEGRIAVRRQQVIGRNGRPYEHHLYFATATPDVSDFSGPEVAIVNETVDDIAERHTAASISEASHDLVYELAEPGEIIPYFTAFSHLLARPSDESKAWAARSLSGRS